MTATHTPPATLGNEDAIPAAERAAAEAFFTTFADNDEKTTAWRREYYLVLRTGWNRVAGRYQENFVTHHGEALDLIVKHCGCRHDWRVTGSWDTRSGDRYRYLGTYESGVTRECSKCGAADRYSTGGNNWSGD